MNNVFVQAVGVGAVTYLLFKGLDWIIIAILAILETLSRWYRFYGSPWAEEAAIGAFFVWLIVAGVMSSRRS